MDSPLQRKQGSIGLLVWSVVNVLMFLPLGLVGLVYSVKASRAADQDKKMRYASKARRWNIAGTIYGVLQIVIAIYNALGIPY